MPSAQRRQAAPAPEALALLLDCDARPVIAHRGASGHAPENTIPSFLLGLALGADAIELDVRLTADGVPVVLHDPTLDRTTDMAGPVAALPLARVREADAGARFTPDAGRIFPYCGRGVRVPTLAEVLDAVPAHPVVVEIKAREAAEPARRVIAERGAAGRCIVSSFDDAAVVPFREAPWIAGASGADVRALRFSLPGLGPRRVPYRALFVPERHRGFPIVTRGFVRAARALGAPVHVWTVNEGADARRLWAGGVAGIISNYPDRILAARAALAAGG